MRLEENPKLPLGDTWRFQIEKYLRSVAQKVNGFVDGRLSAVDNALPNAPTSQPWAKGDFVRNSAPQELGTAGSKYVVFGWICTVGGTPGTWVQARFLTGN